MSEEIDNRMTRFMEKELTEGHFEHTLREISKGTGLTYNDVSKGVERLKTKGLIGFRERGSSKKFVPYYYITKLRDMFENAQKRRPTRKRNQTETINTEKHNSELLQRRRT